MVIKFFLVPENVFTDSSSICTHTDSLKVMMIYGFQNKLIKHDYTEALDNNNSAGKHHSASHSYFCLFMSHIKT